MKNKNRKQKNGYSLIELMVAVGIFVVVVAVNVNIFINVVKVQKKAIETQNVTDNARYALEVITRELRTLNVSLTEDTTYCTDPACMNLSRGPSYATSTLSFISGSENRLGLTVKTYFDPLSGSVKFDDDANDASPAVDITSPNIEVTGLDFKIKNLETSSQPRVTVTLRVQSRNVDPKYANSIILETTISPRQLNL